MVGYFIVLSMLAIALVGTLVVFTADARQNAEAERPPAVIPDVLQWLNISAESTAESGASWNSRLLASMDRDSIELIDLASPGAKIVDLRERLAELAEDADFDIATVWAGPEDLLAGTPLEVFEQTLASLLLLLQARGPVVVVGNIPDLTPELVAAQLAKHDAVKAVIEQWNGSIARLAAAMGATIANLHETAQTENSALHYLNGTSFQPDESTHQAIARRFAQAMTEALEKRLNAKQLPRIEEQPTA